MLENLLDDDDASAGILHSDDVIQCQRLGNDIWLMITTDDHAGAVTPRTGEALLQALSAVAHSHQRKPARTLHLSLGNSAGGDVEHPMESLHLINAILESLWQLHAKNLRIQVTLDGGCYGGMAILLCACADEILMGDDSAIGLLGPRVLKALTKNDIPAQIPDCHFSADHLRLKRISAPS